MAKRDWEIERWESEKGAVNVRLSDRQLLRYDRTGESKAVTVAQGSKPWKRTDVDDGKTVHEHITLQATAGPLKDWYLDFADEEVKFGEVVAHPLILVEKPKHVKRVVITPVDR